MGTLTPVSGTPGPALPATGCCANVHLPRSLLTFGPAGDAHTVPACGRCLRAASVGWWSLARAEWLPAGRGWGRMAVQAAACLLKALRAQSGLKSLHQAHERQMS